MVRKLKRLLALFLCIAVSLMPAACTQSSGKSGNTAVSAESAGMEDQPVTLKVLTEKFMWGQSMIEFNLAPRLDSEWSKHLGAVIRYFEDEHPNVKVEVEYLPTSQAQRETVLQNRRVAISAGEAPDIYLFPTFPEVDLYSAYRNGTELLFNDVEQAMRNGWFADISAYYDADNDLHTEELQPDIMNAGVVDNTRYVLPLRYDFSVLLLDKAAMEKSPFDEDILDRGINAVMEAALGQDDSRWQCFNGFGLSWPLNFFPAICDYDTESIFLKPSALADFLKTYRVFTNTGLEYLYFLPEMPASYLEDYFSTESSPSLYIDENVPAAAVSLEKALAVIGAAKSVGRELTVVPMRNTEGGITANVAYWGAVSADSQYKKTAYDFLRVFLSEEAQFEKYLNASSSARYNTATGYENFLGWPVRYQGSAAARWEETKDYIEMFCYGEPTGRKKELLEINISDADMPVLKEPIDQVNFPSTIDGEFMQLLSKTVDGDMTDRELEKKVRTVLRDLRYHLAEG